MAAVPTTGEGEGMKGYGTLFEAALATILGKYSHHCGHEEAEAYVIELEDGSFAGHVDPEYGPNFQKGTLAEALGGGKPGVNLILTSTGIKRAPGWINRFFKKGIEGEKEPSAKLPKRPGYRIPGGIKVVVTRPRSETPEKVGRPLADNELGVWLRPHTKRIKMWGCYITPALWEALHKAGSIPRLFDALAEL